MSQMHAAVVTSFDEPPHYMTFEVPEPQTGELLVDVLAVGLHPRVRSGAGGAHYTSTGQLPMVPGVDGVARRPDGRLIYFAATDAAIGTMADQAVVDPRRAVELPDDASVAAVAAAMNPAMSSWVALRRRIQLQPGQSVMILGATGNAGTMAVQISKLLGAGQVIGAGRDPGRLQRLLELGADAIVPLGDDIEQSAAALGAAAANVDVVVDYLWGEPAQQTMRALLEARADRSRPLDWIQIGAIAGPTLELPSAFLRSTNIRIQGSGQGSVSGTAYVGELPSLVAEIAAGSIGAQTNSVPLSEVERAWGAAEQPGVRTVLIP